MTITLQNILDQTNDYVRNYVTSTIDLNNRKRAINRATEYFQRRMGLPSDERVYSFYFVSGTFYYDLPDDHNEPIDLIYHDYTKNFPGREFYFSKYPQILRLSGINPGVRYFSTASYNQAKQLLILSNNLNSGNLIETFDNAITEGWVGSGDANSLVLDPNIKSQGNDSLAFNITPSSGTASLVFANYPSTDYSSWANLNFWMELDVWLTTTNFTSIQLVLQSSTGNYYTFTVTANADGTAWVANQFNTLGFKFSQAVATGSPVLTDINYIAINFVEGPAFTAQTSMRVDNMRVVIPDYLDLIYYSNYKATDSTGATDKIDFTEADDIALFGEYAPDLLGPIARRAALELMPQLRQDKEWYSEYKREVKDAIELWGKTYPRKRIINFGQSVIRRTQSSGSLPNYRIQ